MRSTIVPWLLASAALALAGHPPRARACAAAPPEGRTVDVASEEALIVWDAAQHVEHFIRRADFRTDATDFGFLVPTPTQPELAEAPDAVFSRIGDLEVPEVRHENKYRVSLCVSMDMMLMSARSAPTAAMMVAPDVTVLASARVAGLDAVVLDARNAEGLDTWLREHGYATRPALMRWVAPYVSRGWKITAFKLAKGARDERELGTRAVRMSFHADAPFFPYSEPDDQPQRPGRLLRVHVVSSARTGGRISGAAWAGTTTFARPLTGPSTLLRGVVPRAAIPERAWLTSMEERSSTRARADLDFAPSADRSEVVPPPIVEYDEVWIPIPLELIVPAAVVVLLVVRRMRKQRAARGTAP